MPTIRVNGISLAYEVLGSGPVVVWTPGGWFPRDTWAYFNAGSLAATYRTILWDRRNSGLSDIAIDDAPSEFHLWADDLHQLLHALDLAPAYLAGGSAGNLFSLLMAHRYPDDVQGLILIDTPTNDLALLTPIVEAHYLRLAEIAESKDMEAVIDHSAEAGLRMAYATAQPEDWLLQWVAATISVNPSNHARLLAMDPQHFARVMKKWGDECISWAQTNRFHLCGLSDEQVRNLAVPALVIHGFDPLHPRQTAEELYRLLPNAEWVEFSDRHPPELLARVAASDTMWNEISVLSMPFVREFLQRIAAK